MIRPPPRSPLFPSTTLSRSTDRSGLQLGQCLDTANPPDGCALIAAGGLPNPAAPVSFPGNFPNEFFYWRSTADIAGIGGNAADRKSTRLNSSHSQISYAVFC